LRDHPEATLGLPETVANGSPKAALVAIVSRRLYPEMAFGETIVRCHLVRIGKGWSYRNADQDEMLKHAFMSKHVFTWGISGGLGVNPYNGGPNAEFFAGLFGAIDRFTLDAGADWGRISNVGGGFLIGDVVPSGTTIPTTLHYV
jgi:hypothetical protein